MANLLTNIAQVCSDLTNIKNAIVDNGVPVEANTPSSEYAAKISDVYNSGVAYADEVITETNSGLEAVLYSTGEGGKSWYDSFWDVYQQNGNRVSYACGFGGAGWDNTLFNPKYDICPTDSYMMFRSSKITDLRKLPVKLDFSNTGNTQYMFQWAGVKYIGELDVRNVKGSLSSSMFANSSVVSVDLLKVGENNSFSSWFGSCGNLENLIIEGTIAQSGFNVSACKKLNKASIESIINALSNTTSGLTVTLSQTAVDNAFTDEEWATLIAPKTNWTISLV